MPRKSDVVIPRKCLENSKFNKHEHLLVVKAMLLKINLPVFRANNLYLKVRGLGTIFTHGNRKKSKAKYQRKYNKNAWKKQKALNEMSEKNLLF